MEDLKEKLKYFIEQYNPIGLRIVPTYSCDQNCKFCYQKTKSGNFLEMNKLENILKILTEDLKWTPTYITQQGGELSNFPEKSLEMFKLVDKYFPNVFSKSLTTNGFGDTGFYKKSKLYGITHITTSLHKPNLTIQARLTSLKADGFLTTRVNCFLDEQNIDNVKKVFKYCEDRNIQLTLCEDMRLEPTVEYDSTKILRDSFLDDSYKEIKYKQQNVFISEDENFKFWVYKHKDNYDYDNLIVMVNGDVTVDFNDIIKCKGDE